MKKLAYLISLSLIVCTLGLLACGDDDPDSPTLTEQQLSALEGTWSTSSSADVLIGTDPAPGDWSDFTITFSRTGSVDVENQAQEAEVFSVSTFEVSGTGSAESFDVTFNGSASESARVEINNNEMTMSFSISSDTDVLGARSQSVSGSWSFSLTK